MSTMLAVQMLSTLGNISNSCNKLIDIHLKRKKILTAQDHQISDFPIYNDSL